MNSKDILLVGCGKMGRALLEAWLREPYHRYRVTVVKPAELTPSEYFDKPYGVRHFTGLEQVKDAHPDIVVFAVKPQSLDAVLPAYASRFGTKPLYLSIAAGKALAYYQSRLGSDARIVRAIPNLPAFIGSAVTALVATPNLSTPDRDDAHALMRSAGMATWLENEELMHAVTAVSGSGRPMFFILSNA